MDLVELLLHGFVDDAALVVEGAVFFFIDGFQLGLEEAEDRLVKALGLDLGPLG